MYKTGETKQAQCPEEFRWKLQPAQGMYVVLKRLQDKSSGEY